MPRLNLNFGEFRPSVPRYAHPGLIVAENCVVTAGNAYDPMPSLRTDGTDVAGPVTGARTFFDNAGNGIVFGGTDDSLWVRRSGAFTETDASDIGIGEQWDFCRYNDFVIATANANDPQYIADIDTGTAWVDLPGSPPSMKRCARIGNFVMLGNATDSPSGIAWSAFNSPATSWEASRLTQAGRATLAPEFGGIQRIIGGKFGLIFQERGIQRIAYVGPPGVWDAGPGPISEDRGCVAPGAVAAVGHQVFFLAQDGFWVTDGSTFNDIGYERVNQWFFDTVDQNKVDEVVAAVDWQRGAVVWAFADNETPDNVRFNRVIIYSYRFNKWSSAKLDMAWIVTVVKDGTTLDDLDTDDEFSTDGLDQAGAPSLDDAKFLAASTIVGAFVPDGSDSDYATFDGPSLKARFETGELEPSPARNVHCDEIYILIGEGNHSVVNTGIQIVRANGQERGTGLQKIGRHGFRPVSVEGQRLRFVAEIDAGETWGQMQGLQLAYRPAGVGI